MRAESIEQGRQGGDGGEGWWWCRCVGGGALDGGTEAVGRTRKAERASVEGTSSSSVACVVTLLSAVSSLSAVASHASACGCCAAVSKCSRQPCGCCFSAAADVSVVVVASAKQEHT